MQILEGQITRFFFPIFFPAYSVIAKISAHLRLSWLYLIYLTAKSISFLHEKFNPRKFSSLPRCDFLARLVSFSVNFSPIGKIATYPLGSLFDFNPQVKINLFHYNSHRKVVQMNLRFRQ